MNTAAHAVAELRRSLRATPGVRLVAAGRRRRSRLVGPALEHRIGSAVARLHAAGVRRQDTVLLAIRPSVTAVVHLAALLVIGCRTILIDLRRPGELLQSRLRDTPPDVVLTEPIIAIAARLVRSGPAPPLHTLAGRIVTTRRRRHRPPAGLAEPQSTDDALVLFTSGTTAQPRAVVHTQGSLGAMLAAVAGLAGSADDEVVFTDQFHSLFPALLAGARCVYGAAGATPQALARLIGDEGVTTWFTTPPRARAVVPLLPATRLRRIVLGSAPVTAPLIAELGALLPGVTFVAVYAMTEAVPIAVTTGGEILAHDAPGTMLGRPVSGITVRIDESGEIILSGERVGRVGDAPGAEVRTGDLGHLTADGCLVLDGRAKDMILTGAENIYPQHHEPALSAIAGVRAAALVGLPDRFGDEALWLAVERLPGTDEQTVRAAIEASERVSALPIRGIVFVHIPHSGRSAKLDRIELRRLVSQATGRQ